MMKDISIAMDKKQIIVFIPNNFTAAFETKNHKILPDHVLNCFNITSMAEAWFQSNLLDSHQKVHIRSTNLSDFICHLGKFQGSVLYPILFIFYLHLMHFTIENHGLYGQYYANDSKFILAAH